MREFISRLLPTAKKTPYYDSYKEELNRTIRYMDEAYFDEGLDGVNIEKFDRDMIRRQLAIERLLFQAYVNGEITDERYMYIADSLDKLDIKRFACVRGVYKELGLEPV